MSWDEIAPSLLWRHTVSGVQLQVEDALCPVPPRLAAALFEAFPHGLTADPATDLLELERRLRLRALDLIGELQDAERTVAEARRNRSAATGRAVRRARHGMRWAITAHTGLAFALDRTGHDLRTLRRFVSTLPVSEGRLAAAARGWQRRCQRPDYVQPFPGEDAFIQVNPRRAVRAGWGGQTIGGLVYGESWRRDGDEDPRDPEPDLAGRWTVGYIPDTAEVYAVRRCSHLPERLWRLGSNLPATVTEELKRCQEQMREPNSLLLVAERIHHYPRTGEPHPSTGRAHRRLVALPAARATGPPATGASPHLPTSS